MATKTATKPSTTPAPAERQAPQYPAEAPAFEPEPKQPSRSDLLASIKAAGYSGPTSYTATVLRQVTAWLEAGAPKDDAAVPIGVLHAVYPETKPEPAARQPRLTAQERGYRQALADVAALGDDLAAIKRLAAGVEA